MNTTEELIIAASEGNLEKVKYIVEQGINMYTDYYLALRLACENGHLPNVAVKPLASDMGI